MEISHSIDNTEKYKAAIYKLSTQLQSKQMHMNAII